MCETLRYWQMSDTLILKKEGGSGTGWGCGGGGGGGGCRGEGGGGEWRVLEWEHLLIY